MSEDFDKYLAIANHDIQMANDYGQLKSYVASILYDYDKKVELLQQKENIIKEVREYIKFLKKHYEELRTSHVEDSYFINDMLRQMFIQSIENYLIGIEDILDKEK